MLENQQIVIDEIKAAFPDDFIDSCEAKGEVTIAVNEGVLLKLARFIHDAPNLKFDFMANMTVVDYLNGEPPYETRFVAVYHFYSMDNAYRLRIKIPVTDADEKGVDSVVSVWKNAGFFEREAFDMFGLKFNGNPDLRRIYMPDDWKGHPLRKDYPIMGYAEE